MDIKKEFRKKKLKNVARELLLIGISLAIIALVAVIN